MNAVGVVDPQEVQRHSVYGGTSYGAHQRILISGPVSRLMFVPGHTGYVDRASGSKYFPATLWLVRDDMAFSRRIVLSIQGARLTSALLARADVCAAVTEEFGAEACAAMHPRRTVLLAAAAVKMSPYALVQERVCRDLHYPWRVLVCCALLNQTSGAQVRPMLAELLDVRCPDPGTMLVAPLVDLLTPLGLQDRREKLLRRMAWDYLAGQQPGLCHGVGGYGRDALLLFVHDQNPAGVRDGWLRPWRDWRFNHIGVEGYPVRWDRAAHSAWRKASGFEPLREIWGPEK